MAAFNPDVPGIDPTRVPEYLQESRAISPYDIRGLANKGKAIALETAAKVIPEAVDAGYNITKHRMETDMAQLNDQGNDAFISALGTMRKSVDGPQSPSGQPQGGTQSSDNALSLLTKSDESGSTALPAEVTAGLDKAETVKAALAAGKISPTAYLLNRDAIAKELRARYPGLRQEIDAHMGHTANALIHSMITDLNTRGGEENKIRAEVRSEFKELRGMPGVNLWEDAFDAGKLTIPQARAKLNAAYADKYTAANLKSKVEVEEANKDLDKHQLEPYINHVAQQSQAQVMDGILNPPNGPGITDIARAVKDHLDGKDNTTDEQWGQHDQTMTLTRNQAYANFVTEMNQHELGQKSIADRYGLENLKKAFDANWESYDAMHEAIHAKNFPLAMSHANSLKASQEDFTHAMYDNRDVREAMQTLEFLKKQAPEYAQKYFSDHILPTADKITNAMDAQIKLQRSKVVAQPRSAQGGAPNTMDEGLQILKEKLQKQGNPAEAYVAYLDTLKIAIDPKASPKIIGNIADAAFSDGNNSFLNDKNFQRDFVDAKGVNHPGKVAVYQAFGNPTFVQNVIKLNDPQKTENMKNWFELSFAHEIFPGELKELGKLQTMPGVKIYYNTETNSLSAGSAAVSRAGQVATRGLSGALNTSEDQVRLVNSQFRNVNLALRTLGNVEKSTGGDVEAFLVKVLIQQGVDPRKIEGFHAKVLNSIISSRRQMTDEEGKGIVGQAIGTPSPPGQNLGPISGIEYGPETRTRQ